MKLHLLQPKQLKKVRHEIEEWLIIQDDSFYQDLVDPCKREYAFYEELVRVYIVECLGKLGESMSAIEFLKSNQILSESNKEVLLYLL